MDIIVVIENEPRDEPADPGRNVSSATGFKSSLASKSLTRTTYTWASATTMSGICRT